jgi:hypothetical protein
VLTVLDPRCPSRLLTWAGVTLPVSVVLTDLTRWRRDSRRDDLFRKIISSPGVVTWQVFLEASTVIIALVESQYTQFANTYKHKHERRNRLCIKIMNSRPEALLWNVDFGLMQSLSSCGLMSSMLRYWRFKVLKENADAIPWLSFGSLFCAGCTWCL